MSVASLTCPTCGAAIAERALGYARTIACEHCSAVLDASDPTLSIITQSQERFRQANIILPLGGRGTLFGRPWEVIGFQIRRIRVDGLDYEWREYVLFNPVHGFRYLTEYDGHWSWVEPLPRVPKVDPYTSLSAQLDDTTYKHFQTAVAVTRFVLGEFPWEVRVGDQVTCADYVAPPYILSSERSQGEETWSRGTYIAAAEVYRAFGLGTAPAPRGIYANQPNPGSVRRDAMWPVFVMTVCAIVLLLVAWEAFGRHERVFSGGWLFDPSSAVDTAASGADGRPFVTDTFVLRGRASNVMLDWTANIDNSWVYLDLALIDQQRGTALELGRELSYYHGYDGGEAWSEGSRHERVFIPNVPSGTYYLRVAPSGPTSGPPIQYNLTLTRDEPSMTFPLLALLVAALPIGITLLQARAFERKRWMESDHPPPSSDDD